MLTDFKKKRPTAQSMLSVATLALLVDLGAYAVDTGGAEGIPAAGVIVDAGENSASARENVGCAVSPIECGAYPSVATAQYCAQLGIGRGNLPRLFVIFRSELWT
jgi:hypothetical protein